MRVLPELRESSLQRSNAAPGRRALVLVILAFLLSSACVRKSGDEDEKRVAKQAEQLPPGQVKVAPDQQSAGGIAIGTVELKSLPEVFATTAQIEIPTGLSAQVLPPVPGYVEAASSGIPAIGTKVERGQTMAIVRQAYSATDRLQLQVNLQDADAAIKTAQAQRELAQSQLERSRRLYRDKIAPLKQVQQDEAALRTAEVTYQNAVDRNKNYSEALASDSPTGVAGPARFVVTAPISGVVVAADITPGQLAEPSRALFSLVDTTIVWVKVPIPEAQLGSIGLSNSGELTVAAYPNRIFPLRRVASPSTVDASTHTATIIYEVENSRGELKPGMVASVRLVSSRVAQKVTVPEAALVHEARETVVFLQLREDTFQRQPVAISFTNEGQVAVESGLMPGQKVVIAGASVLESQLQRSRIQVAE